MKQVLVTGASRGIGRAIAERLAAPQVRLILHGRDAVALEETRVAVTQQGAQAEIALCDLTDAAAVEEMAQRWAAEPLNVLINNAGIAFVKPVEELTLDEWQRTLAVNVTAPFLLTQKLVGRMKPGASIVNILSVAAKTGFAGWSSYCMSKFALEGFSQSLREELRPRGIRVVNIYPAATDTEIWNKVEGDWPRNKMMSAAEVGEAVAYALARPGNVLVENIVLSDLAGQL